MISLFESILLFGPIFFLIFSPLHKFILWYLYVSQNIGFQLNWYFQKFPQSAGQNLADKAVLHGNIRFLDLIFLGNIFLHQFKCIPKQPELVLPPDGPVDAVAGYNFLSDIFDPLAMLIIFEIRKFLKLFGDELVYLDELNYKMLGLFYIVV